MNGLTKDGHKVIGLVNVPLNSAGHRVTFPIKGSIVLREKPFKTQYTIWTDKGEIDPVWHKNNNFNLDLSTIH